MRIDFYPKYNYVSLTSSKAGSTLVNQIHNYISDSKKSYSFHEIKNLKKILVCRNPYTRCLSAYYNKFLTLKRIYQKNKGLYKLSLPIKIKLWQNLYSAFYIETTTGKSPNQIDCCSLTGLLKVDLTEKIDDSFKNYIKFLKKSITENKWFVQNSHFLPQVNQNDLKLFDNNLIIVKLEEDFNYNFLNALKTVLSINIYDQYISKITEILDTTPNKTSNRLILEGNDYLNYNSDQLIEFMNKNNGLPSIENMLDDDIINFINDIYENDIINLNYLKK